MRGDGSNVPYVAGDAAMTLDEQVAALNSLIAPRTVHLVCADVLDDDGERWIVPLDGERCTRESWARGIVNGTAYRMRCQKVSR